MHDEMLERRLRTTLRDEANGVAFTITAAELERRAALRSRGRADRRLGLLLAAAVGIGLVGVGGALGGLIKFLPEPSQAPDATEAAPSPSPSQGGPVALPDLDQLLADVPADSVVIAQAHGPASGPEIRPPDEELGAMAVLLGELQGSDDFEVLFACRGEGLITIDLAVPQGDRYLFVADATCDGALHRATVSENGPDEVYLLALEPASWRVVVRRLDGSAGTPPDPQPILAVPEGQEYLLDRQGITAGPPSADPSVPPEPGQGLGPVPGRETYTLRAWCRGGDAIRYIHAETFDDGRIIPTTTTHVDCDGWVHEVQLAIAEPGGASVYVAADPGTVWSVLTSSPTPPVDLVQTLPGWQLSGGGGPDLSFSTTTMSFTGPGNEGGGPIMIVVACAGTGTLEIIVDIGVRAGEDVETFVADCLPNGAVTSQTFESKGSYVDVTWPMPAGSWTAVSILVPDPSTAP